MPTFAATTFTLAARWKQSKDPLSDERLNKAWFVHAIEHYLHFNRRAVLEQTTIWSHLEDIMLNEISHTHTHPYHMSTSSGQLHGDGTLEWGVPGTSVGRVRTIAYI